jgi:hypothetical protein
MVRDGFAVAGYEGESPQGGVWNLLPRPPAVGRVRPDASGCDRAGLRIALAEAKTEADIDTDHTRVQLRAFTRAVSRQTETTPVLYLAIPRSAAPALDRVLGELGLIGARGLIRVHVPDILLKDAA